MTDPDLVPLRTSPSSTSTDKVHGAPLEDHSDHEGYMGHFIILFLSSKKLFLEK